MIRQIWAELLRPDAYHGDWYSWMCNQAAHFALVGAPAGFLAHFLGLPLLAVPVAVAAVYGGLWEAVAQRGHDYRDSLADTAAVALGAAFVASLAAHILAGLAVFGAFAALIAWGVSRRFQFTAPAPAEVIDVQTRRQREREN